MSVKAKYDTHPTKTIILEKPKVDEEMVELIKLMNSYRCIDTLYCCQGEEYTDGSLDGCYVMFDCSSADVIVNLARLFSKRRTGCIVSIFWQSDALDGRPMWHLNIISVQQRDEVVEALKYGRKNHQSNLKRA